MGFYTQNLNSKWMWKRWKNERWYSKKS